MNWKIEWMKAVPQAGGVQNYVVECGWRCEAFEQEQSASVYGSCSFALPDGSSGTLTPYNSLTEQKVLSWVWASGVDKEAAESAVRARLIELINPPSAYVAPPWAQGAKK